MPKKEKIELRTKSGLVCIKVCHDTPAKQNTCF